MSHISDINEGIFVRGAREHNLKNISVMIPRNQITVVSGLSGSGKSSLAFDTIYAEGQRRYVESLSAYARNFLEQMKKPEVDSILGLSPAIAIDQKNVTTSPRSTVGTITESYDYLRLLFARVGTPQCPAHHVAVEQQTPNEIVQALLGYEPNSRFMILASLAQQKKGEFSKELMSWKKKGFVSAKIDGKFVDLSSVTKLAKTKPHDIDLVIDKLVLKGDLSQRLAASVNTCLGLTKGTVTVEFIDGKRQQFSIHSACPECGFSFPALEPPMFSFNNPRGACETCGGLGTVDIEEIEDSHYEGDGLVKTLSYRAKPGASHGTADPENEEFDELAIRPCPDCDGTRLNLLARNVLVSGKTITSLSEMSIGKLLETLRQQNYSGKGGVIAEKILKQLYSRLEYLERVGVGYLSLDRPARSLSGGESQRIRLASQLGSGLVGVLYVLDEPSIGLHPRDHHRLLEIIREIKEVGNTVLMVEHDEDTLRSADYLIDLGPRAGVLGGEVVASGSPQEICSDANSVTGAYLSGRKKIPVPVERRVLSDKRIIVEGASGNNLKNVALSLPLSSLTAITGVSGSGKSTLIIDTLFRAISNHFYNSSWVVAPHKAIRGLEFLDKIVEIDQKPIGRTPRSNPATYIGLLPLIRDLFAQLPESRLRGYPPGRFSFNVKGGRCEECQGAGQIRVEMHFMSDIFVQCETCLGRRFNRETLGVKYNGKNIADILDMDVAQALAFFANHPAIMRKLDTLHRVGLDYISLGQGSNTLSGGEAQRIKLSKELSKRSTGKTLYILDEPTTGLHFADIAKLIDLLQELVNQGNTVVVIEHNLDVIKSADYIIDLGPEGGATGGEIVAHGRPEEIILNSRSQTGLFLRAHLDNPAPQQTL